MCVCVCVCLEGVFTEPQNPAAGKGIKKKIP